MRATLCIHAKSRAWPTDGHDGFHGPEWSHAAACAGSYPMRVRHPSVQANEVAAERAKGELGEKLAHENGKESTHKKVRGTAVRA